METKPFLPPGLSLVLLAAFAFFVLLLITIGVLGVISLAEQCMTNTVWRLFAAVGIGSAIVLLIAARFVELPELSEED